MRESRLREELAHAGRVAIAGELATSLAHEVNQPLAAIVTNAQAGQRYLARDGFARADLDEILGEIAQQGRRASEVIRRLREFLRKNQSQRVALDLNQVVRDTLPLLRREIEEQEVRTSLMLQPGLPAVTADPVQLQQVVVNLVKNSCEALSGHPQPRHIEIRTSSYDGRVRMDVSDSGPGLAPEIAARLFQPYVTTKAGGMGLGLAICRSIVEAHGGRLAAEPAPRGGVCFHLDLPADAASEGRA
jgi:C4-dicarboxylate-specific signal transduction histidine kinase